MISYGGLEEPENLDTLESDNITYIVNNNYRRNILELTHSWNAFLNIYKEDIENQKLFDFVKKNLIPEKTSSKRIVKYLKELYNSPLQAHMSLLIDQYMLDSPLLREESDLFIVLRLHFEKMIKIFNEARNNYIDNNKTNDKKNNLDELTRHWFDINNQNKNNTSSLILYFFNKEDSEFNITLEGKYNNITKKLENKLKRFEYPGFCPKVPYDRINKLLDFPIVYLSFVIHKLDNKFVEPNYNRISKLFEEKLNLINKHPECEDKIERLEPKEGSDDKEQTIFYTEKIIMLRKSAMPCAENIEKYYTNTSIILKSLILEIKNEFNNINI